MERLMDVEIATPQEYSGDIMGDLNSRRGRVQGMEARGNQQVIKSQAPMSEMLNYQSTLNSITAARGSFHMQFSHYDPLPPPTRAESRGAIARGRTNPWRRKRLIFA